MINAARKVEWNINGTKIEYTIYNNPNDKELSANGKHLKEGKDFKYLGSWVDNSVKYITITKPKHGMQQGDWIASGNPVYYESSR